VRKLYSYPWLIVAVITVITVFFAMQLPRAELDNNNLRFVPPNDPALQTSRWIDDTFGSSLFILVGLQRQYGTVFDREFLNRIRVYSQIIQEMPIVRDITSLISADYITTDGDAIIAEKLVNDDFSGSVEEIAELKHRLLSWTLYDRALFSDDFTATQILISLSLEIDDTTSKEVTEQFVHIRDIARETFGSLATVYVTGIPVISTTINEAMNDDLKLLVPLVTLVVLLVLFLSFHAFTPVILPLLTVLIATVWSVGAMPLFGIRLSVISTVLPVILIAVGSAYGIHVVTHYLAEFKTTKGSGMTRDEHRELILAVLMKIRRPVFITALTTVSAFASFCFTSVAPCREFGYFASFGVAAAFIVTISLIPALLIIRGPRKFARQKASNTNNDISVFIADNLVSIAQHKKTILFLVIITAIVAVYGISHLIIDNVMVEYFRADTDIYRSDGFIRQQFGGSKVISVVVEADSHNVILRPDTLAAVDGLSVYLQRKVPNVGKVMGFTDLVKRINQVMNVGESPLGKGNEELGMRSEDFGFGFDTDDGFGFGDFGFDADDGFGFGDFGFDDVVLSDADAMEQGRATNGLSSSDKIYTESELFALLDRAGNEFRGMNANDLIWELKRQVNYDGVSYYEIPLDPGRYGKKTSAELQQLIGNYLVLLSGNISAYANDPLEPTAIKATVQLRTMGMKDSEAVFDEIVRYVVANFPSDVRVTLGGTTMVEDSLNSLVVQSQLISIIISIICIFIIISITNKTLVAGAISIIPLCISMLINFAVMGFAGIKLNLGTSMVAAVAVGVGIDYTIHCIEAYKREWQAMNRSGISSGVGNFLRNVFFSSGKAIIINAVSVGAGFAVLIFSRFTMLADLGLLIAIAMLSSALASLTILPALLSIIKPKFIYGVKSEE
jgi:predicted RND superfamily exporter protein